jgi:hypothetical protein
MTAARPHEEHEGQRDFVYSSSPPAFLHSPVSAWAVTSDSTAFAGGTATTSNSLAPHSCTVATTPQEDRSDQFDVLPRAVATYNKSPQFPSTKQQQPNVDSSDDDAANIIVVEAITLPAYAEHAQPYSVPALPVVDVPAITRRWRSRTRRRIRSRRGARPDSEQWDTNDGGGHGHGSTASDDDAIATPVMLSSQHPKVAAFKRRRQRRTVAAGVIGGVVGGVLFAPLGVAPAGVVLGALTAGAAAKVVGKHRQRRLARRLMREEKTRS